MVQAIPGRESPAEDRTAVKFAGRIFPSDINAPKQPPDPPGRGIDCEVAIQLTFQALIAAAVTAGWNEAEVAEAVLELAHNHIAGMLADQGTERHRGRGSLYDVGPPQDHCFRQGTFSESKMTM
ncbi:MAG: hypothetical protein EON58_18335 [Alphaproteobacteria bacterium]|nr:MAG: hypothetical protein EON58_18335 [Alphaproteobacteria bacterium]